MYAILFNDIKEASEWRVGSAMYYAPAASQFTHTVLTEKLRQQVFHYFNEHNLDLVRLKGLN